MPAVWRYAHPNAKALIGIEWNRIVSSPVGQQILQTLRDTAYIDMTDASLFFSFDPRHLTLTLHYPTTSAKTGSTKAFTLHLAENMVWTPQTFSEALMHSTTCAVPNVGSGTHGSSVEENTFFGSLNGYVYYYSDTTSLDFDTAKEAQYMSGGLWTGDPERTKFMDEMRLDVRSDIASNITVRTSGNLGGAFATGAEVSISAQSNTSQVRVFPDVSGTYHSVMLTSDDTGWEVSRIAARARVTGESL